MRWEAVLPPHFGKAAFERAFEGFRAIYHVRPERALCAPDVLARYAAVYALSSDAASQSALSFGGISLAAAILPPGTIAFEGCVDEERMGDW